MQLLGSRVPGKFGLRVLISILFSVGVISCSPIQPSSTAQIPIETVEQSSTPAGSTSSTPPPSRTPTLAASSTTEIELGSQTPSPTITASSTPTPEPFYCGPIQIGTSVAGKPLEVHRFGTGFKQRLILAGIHGGYEWNTIKLAEQLIEYFQANPSLIPEDRTLFILPSLNPDGAARGHGPVGRANNNGVDLNRNFPVHWKADWPRTGCWQMGPITAGDYPLSEPESAALANFLLSQSIDAFISYHSAGPGIYPVVIPEGNDSIGLAKTLSEVSPAFPYPPLDTGCEQTGSLVDFAINMEITAVDVELSTHWDPELEANLELVKAFLAWVKDDENVQSLSAP